MKTNDIPAFPVAFLQGNNPHGADAAPGQEGMSLRDWFAGQALTGLLAGHERSGSPKDYAESAYLFAHAMLEVRNR